MDWLTFKQEIEAAGVADEDELTRILIPAYYIDKDRKVYRDSDGAVEIM